MKMGYYISILPEILLAAMLTSAFGIFFLTTLKIFRQTGLFQRKTAIVMALLVSVSAIAAGSAQLLAAVPGNTTGVDYTRSVTVNYSLLPLVTVAGVIVMLQLFVIAATTVPDETDEVSTEKPVDPSTKPKSRGTRKKKEPAEGQSKEVARTAGASS